MKLRQTSSVDKEKPSRERFSFHRLSARTRRAKYEDLPEERSWSLSRGLSRQKREQPEQMAVGQIQHRRAVASDPYNLSKFHNFVDEVFPGAVKLEQHQVCTCVYVYIKINDSLCQ